MARGFGKKMKLNSSSNLMPIVNRYEAIGITEKDITVMSQSQCEKTNRKLTKQQRICNLEAHADKVGKLVEESAKISEYLKKLENNILTEQMIREYLESKPKN